MKQQRQKPNSAALHSRITVWVTKEQRRKFNRKGSNGGSEWLRKLIEAAR